MNTQIELQTSVENTKKIACDTFKVGTRVDITLNGMVLDTFLVTKETRDSFNCKTKQAGIALMYRIITQ